MDLKRPAEEAAESDAKRLAAVPEGPLTLEDIDTFQKDAIYRQLQDYRRQVGVLTAQIEASAGGPTSLQTELAEMSEKFLQACKKLERYQSASVTRCLPNGGSKASNATKQETPDDTPKPEAGGEAVDSSEAKARIELLNEEIKGLEAAGAKREEQLKQESEKCKELDMRILALEQQLASLPEEKLLSSESGKALVAQTHDLRRDNRALEEQLAQKQEALAKLQSSRVELEISLQKNMEETKASSNKKIDQLEADVRRLRTARDDALSEINTLKAGDKERTQQLETLRAGLAASEEQVQSLIDASSSAAAKGESLAATEVDEAATKGLDDLKALALKMCRQYKILQAELPGVEAAFAKAHAKANAKVKTSADVAEQVAALQASKVKAEEKYFGAMRAKDSLAAELAKAKQSLAMSAEVVANLKTDQEKHTSNALRIQRLLGEAESKASSMQRQLVALERSRSEAQHAVNQASHATGQVQAQLQAKSEELLMERQTKRQLEQQVEKLKKQVDAKRATSGLGSAEAIQEQIESLRSIALCSVCQKNWKDTAIKVCGHVLCRDCVSSRLQNRMRKCPMCNCQFGQNDVMQVHL